MMRGIERRLLFQDDIDRAELVHRLEQLLPESGTVCFAWVFMPNHVHLLIRSGTHPVSRLMARVNTGYAMYFNRRHERVGHLFQNRFRSRLVHGHDDLLGVIRYIHRNPLEAGIVTSEPELAAYPWCSHGALVAARPAWQFEFVGQILSFVAERWEDAVATLRRWASADDAEAAAPAEPTLPREWEWRVRPLVPEATSIERLLLDVARRFGIAPSELLSRRRTRDVCRAREALICAAAVRLGLSGAEIARSLRLSRSAVSQAMARAKAPTRVVTGRA